MVQGFRRFLLLLYSNYRYCFFKLFSYAERLILSNTLKIIQSHLITCVNSFNTLKEVYKNLDKSIFITTKIC